MWQFSFVIQRYRSAKWNTLVHPVTILDLFTLHQKTSHLIAATPPRQFGALPSGIIQMQSQTIQFAVIWIEIIEVIRFSLCTFWRYRSSVYSFTLFHMMPKKPEIAWRAVRIWRSARYQVFWLLKIDNLQLDCLFREVRSSKSESMQK